MAYIAIRSFDNYIPANIILSRLKDEGFDCYIQDENTITIDPLLSPAIGGMKIMIKEEDHVRVRAILDEIENDYLGSLHCPRCHATAIQKLTKISKPKNLLSALLIQLVNGSPTENTVHYRCSNCGHDMEELPVQ